MTESTFYSENMNLNGRSGGWLYLLLVNLMNPYSVSEIYAEKNVTRLVYTPCVFKNYHDRPIAVHFWFITA